MVTFQNSGESLSPFPHPSEAHVLGMQVFQ